jgi:DNA-binding MarR family transcriptional regulator
VADAAREPRLSYVIGRLDRAVRRRLTESLDELGVTLPEYTALSVLRRGGGLSNAQLSRRVLITPQSAIKVISTLERKGLIERQPDPDHGRILRTAITEEGHGVLKACDRIADEIEAGMLEGLSREEREQLDRALRNCLQGLGAGLSTERRRV